MDRRQFIVSLGALAAASAGDTAFAAASKGKRAAAALGGDARLRAALDGAFQDAIANSPEFATALGLDKGKLAPLKSQLTMPTAAERARDLARTRKWHAVIRAIPAASLSETGKRHQALANYMMAQRSEAPTRFGIDSLQRPYRLYQQGGAYFDTPDFINSQHTIKTASDAEAYLSRLAAFAKQIDADSAEQRAQSARGYTAPGWSLDMVAAQIGKLRAPAAGECGLVKSLTGRATAAGIGGDWQRRAEEIVAKQVYPALDRQLDLVRQLRRTTAAGDGAWRLPRGAELYAAALKEATTTNMTPEEVHKTGLDQVAEITAQLDTILRQAGLTSGTVGERLTALNSRPEQLYADTDEGRRELIDDLNKSVAKMIALLPRAFADIPDLPLEIRRVPVDIQDGASNGYYNSPALDGSRPGIYWINLKSVGDWPKYSLPALTFHEGNPGHHLQGSYAQTSGDLPMLLRNSFYSAYGEGWALYAEQVADELGAYSGIERAGYLQSFLFRASRLVIDTGLHHKRWSREQGVDYMVKTTGFARPRAQREVERYCTMMGQACSYKIGHMSWVHARERAEKALGSKFSLPWFHAVLKDGAMPLSMFDTLVDARIRQALAAK